MSQKSGPVITSREQLLGALAEAAELEHLLMCQYLYATFSIKNSFEDGLTATELQMTQKWRKSLLDICIQEMGHLALVCNLTTAIGGSIKLTRADFPVRSGLFPEDFVLELMPFSLETLKHFIFLERSDEMQIQDDGVPTATKSYSREKPSGRLCSHTGDYETVGQLYQGILDGLIYLSEKIGSEKLFCGSPSLQLGPQQVKMDGLRIIKSIDCAKKAIELIVEQGEGSRTKESSHFEKFSALHSELAHYMESNPKFTAARNVAINPVMIKPINPNRKTWVDAAEAAEILDFANALYTFMLRLLLQTYSMELRPLVAKTALVESAFSVMHTLSLASDLLTTKRASADPSLEVNAGLSFDINRHFSPLELNSEKMLLLERINQLQTVADKFAGYLQIQKILDVLKKVENNLSKAL